MNLDEQSILFKISVIIILTLIVIMNFLTGPPV